MSEFDFVKKPVRIQAVQWLAEEMVVVPPAWFTDAIERDVIEVTADGVLIKTLEGTMTGSVGDWIIRGVKNEIYPCKPDIFAATYDKLP